MEGALSALGFTCRDRVQQHSVGLEILREIESRLPGNPNRAKPEQRDHDPAQAFHQTIIVCRFPHGDVPT